MVKRYEVIDLQGRRWALAMTAAKAVKIAAQIEAEKGLKCQVRGISNEKEQLPVQGGN